MKLSDKQTLLSYFRNKDEKQLTVVCNITGMHFTLLAPVLPNIQGLVYSGLSPLADLRAAETYASYSYREAHHEQDPQALAGAILSLFYHYNLRRDKLSAVEANMVLSQLPAYVLSKALNYIVALTPYERKRVDGISLAEGEPYTLKAWLNKCYDVLDITNYATEEEVVKPSKKPLIINTVTAETRAEAKTLLASLKATTKIDSKLATIVAMSLSKNNLALLSPELRSNIVKSLEKLEIAEAFDLAAIFKKAGSEASQQETTISKLLDEPVSIFPQKVASLTDRMSLKEIIAMKKEEEARKAKQITAIFQQELLSISAEIDGIPLEDTAEPLPESSNAKSLTTSTISPTSPTSSLVSSSLDNSSDELISGEDALAYAVDISEIEEAEVEELDFDQDNED